MRQQQTRAVCGRVYRGFKIRSALETYSLCPLNES